jgi:hypothetical protein
MTRWVGLTILHGMAVGLTAAQLSIGTVSIGPGQTGNLSVALTSGGAQISALQFDLSYDRAALTVTIDIGSAASCAAKTLSLNDLGTGQRAIIEGVRSVIADGAVTNLTITVAAGAKLGNRPLTLTNLVAVDPNANLVTLSASNGAVNVAGSYMVGDVYPHTADAVGNFGDQSLDIQDLLLVLFAVTQIPGYTPAACSDRFDAMDADPVDTGTVRGGNGVLDIQDLIRELFRVTSVDKDRPVRVSLGGCGSSGQTARASRVTPLRSVPADGRLVLGRAQHTTQAEERVPVYLEATHDLVRVALTFGIGDQQSRLRFEAAETAPSLSQDSQPGAVAVAWLEGVSIRAGGRLLLGYVVGPAGVSANLKLYGTSAVGLADSREVLLEGLTGSGRDR